MGIVGLGGAPFQLKSPSKLEKIGSECPFFSFEPCGAVIGAIFVANYYLTHHDMVVAQSLDYSNQSK